MTQNAPNSLAENMAGKYRKNRVFMLKGRVNNPSMVKVSEQGNATGQAVVYPNSLTLPAEAVIYDEKKNTNRVIRYVLGEESIYKDEQSQSKDIPVKIQRIEFTRGMISVRPEEPTLLALLLSHPRNESNPKRDTTKVPIFFEYKPEEGIAEMMKEDDLLTEAKAWCKDADWDELRMHATVLNVNTDQSPKEVRWELMKKYAEPNPAKFLEGLHDKTNLRKYTILDAVKNNILTIDAANNSIKWTNGNVVCLAPVGVDPVVHLTNQTFADSRGEELFSHIKALLSPAIVGAPKEAEEKFKIQLPDDAQTDIIKEAIAAGVIKDKVSWLYYKKGTPEAKSWNGKKVLLKELNENAEFKALIIDEITKLKIPS